MISRTRSRIAASNPSRREPSWSTSLSVLVFTMAYSSCALNLLLRDSGLLLSMTSQENTPSTFLQESRQNLVASRNARSSKIRASLPFRQPHDKDNKRPGSGPTRVHHYSLPYQRRYADMVLRIGSTRGLEFEHQREGGSVFGKVMLSREGNATSICSVTGQHSLCAFPIYASPSVHLAMDVPLAGSDTDLPCSAAMTRSRRCSLYAGSVVCP